MLKFTKEDRIPPVAEIVGGVLKIPHEGKRVSVQTEDGPMLAGTLTDWQYVPMIKIEEFLIRMDPDYEHPFDSLMRKEELG